MSLNKNQTAFGKAFLLTRSRYLEFLKPSLVSDRLCWTTGLAAAVQALHLQLCQYPANSSSVAMSFVRRYLPRRPSTFLIERSLPIIGWSQRMLPPYQWILTRSVDIISSTKRHRTVSHMLLYGRSHPCMMKIFADLLGMIRCPIRYLDFVRPPISASYLDTDALRDSQQY